MKKFIVLKLCYFVKQDFILHFYHYNLQPVPEMKNFSSTHTSYLNKKVIHIFKKKNMNGSLQYLNNILSHYA